MGAKRSRDEKKDLAAEKRRIQQERDRRQRRIMFGIAVPVALVIIAIVPVTNWWHAHQRGKQHAVGYVKAASAAAKSASCTGVRNDRQITTSIVAAKTTVDYAALTAKAGNSLPPTSGPRESTLLPATPAFYAIKSAPRPEQAVGNLYHGYVIVWYDSKLPAADVKTLQTAAATATQTIVVPWTRSVFPGDQHVVFTAWDRSQRCKTASAAVLNDFSTTYVNDTSGATWASPSAPSPTVPDTSTDPSAIPSDILSQLATANPSANATVTLPPTTTTPTAAPTTDPTASLAPSTTFSPQASVSAPQVTVTPVR
ncbi:MAG: hypothetical protein JWN96_22 [Mycobacterium sp.]|nr:hypothetical protein [Mycobacterium sp.]